MNYLQQVKDKLEKLDVDYKIHDVKTDDYSVDAHVKELGIKYAEGLSTLIFRVRSEEYVAVLRRDDRNIDSKALKKAVGSSRVSFASDEDLAKLKFKPGLASPIILNDLQDDYTIKVLVDSAAMEMTKVICGSTSPKHAVELQKDDLLNLIGDYKIADISEPNLRRQDSLNERKRILTGDRPTGKLHIGHLVGSLLPRVELQDEYETFILIANIHALSDNFDNPEKVKNSIGELLCDYYAVGIDFTKTTVYIQSEVPEVHEIFMYLSNFTSIQQLMHNPTLKTEIHQNRMEESTPLGFFIYPAHQAADILCVNADLVPVGKDQAPMVEDTREVARKFNATYGVTVLNQPEAFYGLGKNLPGIDGNAKMGKSLNNGIYLADSEAELKSKVMSVYTDPNRIRATDPGTIEGNVSFIYHDVFNEDKEEVADLKERYKKGSVGDVEVKEKLFLAMNNKLTPIREKRKEAEGKRKELFEYVMDGNKKVRHIARGIADQMKEAMKIKF